MRIRQAVGSGAALLALLLAGGSARAQSAPLWHQDFEKQMPGEAPRGWQRSWGDQGDDLVVISNVRAASGERSLLLDRASGVYATLWGLASSFPDVPTGWLSLSFDLLAEGAGNDTHFSFEVRAGNQYMVALSVRDGKLSLQPTEKQGWVHGGAVPLGECPAGVWHRVRLWLPTAGGGQNRVVGALEQLRAGGKWAPVGPARAVAGRPPAGKYGLLMLVPGQGKRNFRVYLDDCRVERAESAPAAE